MIQKDFLKKNQKQDFFERYSENRSIASSRRTKDTPALLTGSHYPGCQILDRRFYFYTISPTEDYP